MSQTEATSFSSLSDDLLLIIFERLASKPSSSFRLCSNFSSLATFSCVSRQCKRVITRSRGWESACRAVFPALNDIFPLGDYPFSIADAQAADESNGGSREAHYKEGDKHTTDWAALAQVLSVFPGHGVNGAQPVFTVEECNPEALVRKPFQELPFRMQSTWEESLKRGAAILGPWLAWVLATKPVHVIMLQDEDCIADRFNGQTGTKWFFNCFAIFWGFVAGFDVLEKLASASERTDYVCPVCCSPMRRIPAECVATKNIDPGVAEGLEPQFFCCRKGHLYGMAACYSYRWQYNWDSWTCSGCGGYPGQTVSDEEESDPDLSWSDLRFPTKRLQKKGGENRKKRLQDRKWRGPKKTQKDWKNEVSLHVQDVRLA